MLQETHFYTGSYPSCYNKYSTNWYHSTNLMGKMKGVSIALRKALQAKVRAHLVDPEG